VIVNAGETVTVETNVGKGFENDAMTGSISISKHSADGKLDGWQFRVYGSALTGQKYDKTFTTDKDGKITVADLRIGDYTVEEVTAGIVGYITPDSQNVTVEHNNTATLEFTNIPIGNVHVTKVDKDYPDNKLTGAKFTVYAIDGMTEVGKLTEVTAGEYQLNDLPYGDYLLRETKSPENYVLDSNLYAFSIREAGKTVTVETNAGKGFENNAITGSISISKQSADGVLSGWQFRVTGTAITGQKYDKTFTTDAKGTIIISNLRIGDYKVIEVKTDKTVGYITEDSKDIEVQPDTITTVNFTNKPYGHIVINKVDAKTGEKVTGASFGIFTDSACKTVAKAYKSETDSSLVNAVITEIENGKYTCNFLPIGNAEGTVYYIKELTAPDGYYLDKNTYAVVLKTANATVSIDNEFGKSDFNEYPYGHATIIKEWKLDNSTADMTADEIAQMKAELEKGLYFTVKNSNGKYITATGADGVYKYNSESATEFRYILKNGAFVIAELPTGEYTSAMTGNTLICPLCGKPVIKKKVGWCCTGYSKDNPDSCKFYIANEICGKKISDVIAKELTLKRATSIIKGFTSQSGKTFDAKLTIKDDNTIGFEFPERLKCPICGKEMVKSSKGWVCTGYRSGCSFFIAGTICGKCITETIAAMLCANKRTRIINGFTSKAGKAFSAALVVKDGKIDFDFPAKSQKRNK